MGMIDDGEKLRGRYGYSEKWWLRMVVFSMNSIEQICAYVMSIRHHRNSRACLSAQYYLSICGQ
jgi:hypothetical protein